MDIIWDGLIQERQRFETNNLWRHDMMAMEQFVAGENPLMALWNLWIDNRWFRWLMDHAALHLDGIRNPESSRVFPCFFWRCTKQSENHWEKIGQIIFHDPIHPYKWVVQNTRIFLKRILTPESLQCQGRQPLEVGTVCQAERIRGNWCLNSWYSPNSVP